MFAWNNRYFISVLFQVYFMLCEPLEIKTTKIVTITNISLRLLLLIVFQSDNSYAELWFSNNDFQQLNNDAAKKNLWGQFFSAVCVLHRALIPDPLEAPLPLLENWLDMPLPLIGRLVMHMTRALQGFTQFYIATKHEPYVSVQSITALYCAYPQRDGQAESVSYTHLTLPTNREV